MSTVQRLSIRIQLGVHSHQDLQIVVFVTGQLSDELLFEVGQFGIQVIQAAFRIFDLASQKICRILRQLSAVFQVLLKHDVGQTGAD